jgi:hypothetical protein
MSLYASDDDNPTTSFFGFMGGHSCPRICEVWCRHFVYGCIKLDLIIKSIISVVMAGFLGIYGVKRKKLMGNAQKKKAFV